MKEFLDFEAIKQKKLKENKIDLRIQVLYFLKTGETNKFINSFNKKIEKLSERTGVSTDTIYEDIRKGNKYVLELLAKSPVRQNLYEPHQIQKLNKKISLNFEKPNLHTYLKDNRFVELPSGAKKEKIGLNQNERSIDAICKKDGKIYIATCKAQGSDAGGAQNHQQDDVSSFIENCVKHKQGYNKCKFEKAYVVISGRLIENEDYFKNLIPKSLENDIIILCV